MPISLSDTCPGSFAPIFITVSIAHLLAYPLPMAQRNFPYRNDPLSPIVWSNQADLPVLGPYMAGISLISGISSYFFRFQIWRTLNIFVMVTLAL